MASTKALGCPSSLRNCLVNRRQLRFSSNAYTASKELPVNHERAKPMPMNPKDNILPQSIWQNPIHFIACGFGVGAIPLMPGTFGTLVGIMWYLVLYRLPLWAYLWVAILCLLTGFIICDITSRKLGTDDHPAIVWDEIVGFLFTMIAIPPTWYFILTGFLLFRLFDIWKPWPIRWVDRHIHGGVGVMLDDLVAALFALVVLQILALFISPTIN